MNMTIKTAWEGVSTFIVLVSNYFDMWERISHMLETLTNLTPNRARFEWTEVKQKEL